MRDVVTNLFFIVAQQRGLKAETGVDQREAGLDGRGASEGAGADCFFLRRERAPCGFSFSGCEGEKYSSEAAGAGDTTGSVAPRASNAAEGDDFFWNGDFTAPGCGKSAALFSSALRFSLLLLLPDFRDDFECFCIHINPLCDNARIRSTQCRGRKEIRPSVFGEGRIYDDFIASLLTELQNGRPYFRFDCFGFVALPIPVLLSFAFHVRSLRLSNTVLLKIINTRTCRDCLTAV